MGPSICANSASGVSPSGFADTPRWGKRPTMKVNGLYGILPLGIIFNTEISSGAKVFFAFLFSVSYANGGMSWYSQKRAAQLLHVEDRTIRRWCAELEKASLISQRLNGSVLVTQIKRDALGGSIFLIEEGPDKNVRSHRTKLSGYTGQKCPTNNSKEGEVMNEKDGVRPPVARRADPSSIPMAADKSVKLSREAKDKLARKRFAKEKELLASGTMPCDQWKGTKFYEYLRARCAQYDVPIADMVDHAKDTPKIYAGFMNNIIESCEKRGITKQQLVHMLDRLVTEWRSGASDVFSRNGKLEIYLVRRNADRLIEMFGPKDEEEMSEPEPDYLKNARHLSDLKTVSTKTQEKKEDNA